MTDAPTPSSFQPIPVATLDLLQPSDAPRPNAQGELSLLLMAGDIPVGNVLLDQVPPRPDHAHLRDASLRALGTSLPVLLRSRRAATGIGTSGPQLNGLINTGHRSQSTPNHSAISVIVCTLGREPRLPRTIEALLAQTHDNFELCIVDNDPQSGSTRTLLTHISDNRIRIIAEPTRGLSVARNTGLAHAAHPLVAFTDDDAVPAENWLAEIVSVFEADGDEAVTAVTGLVRTAELTSPEQLWFEDYGGFDKGYERRVWSCGSLPASVRHLGSPAPRGPFFPYTAGKVGSGNNMAFRTSRLRELGGFDVALGAGSIAQGGEDLDTFSTVLLAGDVIIYTPSALVWHHHRQSYGELRTQMTANGVGMGAVIAKQALRGPRHAAFLAVRAPRALLNLLSPNSPRNSGRGANYPRDLVMAELVGLLTGPCHLLRSRRAARVRHLRGPATTAAR